MQATPDDERSESTQDNFGKFIYQFQPETKTLIRKLERILIKSYRQNVSLLFNQIYIYIYIYYMVVCDPGFHALCICLMIT